MKVSRNVTLRKILGSYVNIAEPKKSMNGEEMEYSIQIILSEDHPDLPKLQETIQEMITEAHGTQRITNYGLRSRDADGGGKEFFINARKKEKFGAVPVYSRAGAPITPDADSVFSGCIFNAQISLYTFDFSGNRGVGCGVQGLQIVDNVNVRRLDSSVDLGSVFTPMDDEAVEKELGPAEAPVADAAPAPEAKAAIPW